MPNRATVLSEMHVSDIANLLEGIQSASDYHGQIAHHEILPERAAEFAELTPPLPELLVEALRRQGIEQLYRHQAQAIELVRAGANVCLVTSTASGKSLAYNAPVIETLLRRPPHLAQAIPRTSPSPPSGGEGRGDGDSEARALYLFPTKALAQDQKRKLEELGLFPAVKAGTYDGDTPLAQRRVIRQVAQIVMTNPDMLHVGILPNHALWSRFLMNLRFIVVDEMHAYRGITGSHVAHTIRRLRRLCAHYRSSPQFICASATIANPAEAVERLTGLPFQIVNDDSSPRSEKHFLLWNPPLLEAGNSALRDEEWLQKNTKTPLATRRRSANSEAIGLFKKLLERDIRTITFTRARVTAEVILKHLRAELPARLKPKLMAYRAGYLPEQRREIEQELFSGRLLGVASTNALELGVDIGGLDAAIIVGYPGSIASTFQQAGRAGRGTGAAVVVLIAMNGPLDQFIIRHPEFLFGRSSEEVVIDPDNVYVLGAHLLCAAHEHPLSDHELSVFGLKDDELLRTLEAAGFLVRRDRWQSAQLARPHDQVSIRSATGQPYEIRDSSRNGELIGMADAQRAFLTVHEGAIYLHQGESYLIERLDLAARCAWARPTEANYYTRPMTTTETAIIEVEREGELPNGWPIQFGVLRAKSAVVGYRRIQQFTESVLSIYPLDFPPSEFETRGLWFSIPERSDFMKSGSANLGTLHALEHAAIAMMPLLATCDPDDIGGVSYDFHPETGLSTIFIYDGYPGGAGFAERAFERVGELLEATLNMLRECECPVGCPSCVQSPRCGNNNEPLDKGGAMVLLEALTEDPVISKQ